MDFASEMSRAAALFESGKLEDAADIFKRLCEQKELNRTGRVMAAINLATTYDKMGHPEHAVSTHEYAVSVAMEDYLFAQDNRAAYLHKIGRTSEAIAVWEQMLATEFLTQDRADAYRHNIAVASAGDASP